AEDGIRVPLVTGVQTCALPISQVAVNKVRRLVPVASLVRQRDQVCDGRREPRIEIEDAVERDPGLADRLVEQPGEVVVELAEHRSEERRVGKGGRGRMVKRTMK